FRRMWIRRIRDHDGDAAGESQPELQSTLAGRVAVVIANPTDPHAPHRATLRIPHEQDVVDRPPRPALIALWHLLLHLHVPPLADCGASGFAITSETRRARRSHSSSPPSPAESPS